MSDTLARIRELVGRGEVITSVHGFRELAADDILLDDVTGGITKAIVVEEYAEALNGPSVLVLQHDRLGRPCTSYGAFRKEGTDRPRSSRPTGPP